MKKSRFIERQAGSTGRRFRWDSSQALSLSA